MPERRRARGARGRLAPALLLAAAALTWVRCTANPDPAEVPRVAVLLERGAPSAGLELDGPYVVLDARGRTIARGSRLERAIVRGNGPDLDLNGVPLAADEILLRPTSSARFGHGGRSYPGELRVVRGAGGTVDVQNLLDIEEYLAGVLFAEMPASFPEEALRAQSVAARTYACYRLESGDPLLRATEADQVYAGAGPLHERARAIVASTRGAVLESDGAILPAFFMSTCGGATTDGPRVFPDAPNRGLEGVPCSWCRDSPRYRWSRSIPIRDLERGLRLAAGSLKSLSPRRDGLGHSISFDLALREGARTISATELRRAWNQAAAEPAQELPSGWLLSLQVSRGALAVDGAGFGHGVGLCQYGAAGLARSGRDFRAILAHYYRGARLVRRW